MEILVLQVLKLHHIETYTIKLVNYICVRKICLISRFTTRLMEQNFDFWLKLILKYLFFNLIYVEIPNEFI
jgi:hypothetical protein